MGGTTQIFLFWRFAPKKGPWHMNFFRRHWLCPLVSHFEYAPRALVMLEKDGTDRQTDGRTPDRYLTLSTRRCQHENDTPYIVTDDVWWSS